MLLTAVVCLLPSVSSQAESSDPLRTDMFAPVSSNSAPRNDDLRSVLDPESAYPSHIEQRRKMTPAERTLLRKGLRESMRGAYELRDTPSSE